MISPFQNFNDAAVEVWEWLSNLTDTLRDFLLLIHVAVKVSPC